MKNIHTPGFEPKDSLIDQTTPALIRELYAGWLQSDLVEAKTGVERANVYYEMCSLIEHVQFWADMQSADY